MQDSQGEDDEGLWILYFYINGGFLEGCKRLRMSKRKWDDVQNCVRREFDDSASVVILGQSLDKLAVTERGDIVLLISHEEIMLLNTRPA